MRAMLAKFKLWRWERMHETPLAFREISKVQGILEPRWVTEVLATRPASLSEGGSDGP